MADQRVYARTFSQTLTLLEVEAEFPQLYRAVEESKFEAAVSLALSDELNGPVSKSVL